MAEKAEKFRVEILKDKKKEKSPTRKQAEITAALKRGHRLYLEGRLREAREAYESAGMDGLPSLVSLFLVQGELGLALGTIEGSQ